MAHFIKLRNEPGGNMCTQWIDTEKIDSFQIEALTDYYRLIYDIQSVQFYCLGRHLGTALIFGEERATEYALDVIQGGGGLLPEPITYRDVIPRKIQDNIFW